MPFGPLVFISRHLFVKPMTMKVQVTVRSVGFGRGCSIPHSPQGEVILLDAQVNGRGERGTRGRSCRNPGKIRTQTFKWTSCPQRVVSPCEIHKTNCCIVAWEEVACPIPPG